MLEISGNYSVGKCLNGLISENGIFPQGKRGLSHPKYKTRQKIVKIMVENNPSLIWVQSWIIK